MRGMGFPGARRPFLSGIYLIWGILQPGKWVFWGKAYSAIGLSEVFLDDLEVLEVLFVHVRHHNLAVLDLLSQIQRLDVVQSLILLNFKNQQKVKKIHSRGILARTGVASTPNTPSGARITPK